MYFRSKMNFDRKIEFGRPRQCPRLSRNLDAILKAYLAEASYLPLLSSLHAHFLLSLVKPCY